MRERLDAALDLLEREEVRSISRRYFISNGFDGTLTSVGVVVGSYLSGVPDGLTVFKIGVGAAVGLATSGVWSVWEIERAEKRAERLQLEAAMLTDLGDTQIQRRNEGARRINALMSGLGPVVGILVPLSPALLEGTYLSLLQTTLLGIVLGVALLFLFGAYLGRLSKQSWVVAGLRMGLAGIVVAGINVALPG
jgi:predicted membrane protein (TIGR00267 family)